MSSTGASGEPELRVICGPTGAGKSAIAMWLAERYGASIVSADSRQIYRGFDVGTAKPTAAERSRIAHYGIDVADPHERYSAAEWAAGARRWIADARARGRPAIIVGGTGFYLRALVEPLFDAPEMDATRRQALDKALDAMPTPELARWCRVLDPERAHLGRAQLLRAIETALLLGQRLSALHRTRARTPGLAARYLVIDPGPILATRLAARVDEMFARGWEAEVRELLARVAPDAPAWNATGYEAVRAVVQGALDRGAARERVIIETRQYAKRQRTWFRHQLPADRVARLDPDDPQREARLDQWWAEGANA